MCEVKRNQFQIQIGTGLQSELRENFDLIISKTIGKDTQGAEIEQFYSALLRAWGNMIAAALQSLTVPLQTMIFDLLDSRLGHSAFSHSPRGGNMGNRNTFPTPLGEWIWQKRSWSQQKRSWSQKRQVASQPLSQDYQHIYINKHYKFSADACASNLCDS